MASAGSQHCANCIGTLPFVISLAVSDAVFTLYNPLYNPLYNRLQSVCATCTLKVAYTRLH